MRPFSHFSYHSQSSGCHRAGRGRQDLEVLRRAVAVRRERQAVLPGPARSRRTRSRRLVSFAAEGVAALQVRAREQPVVGPVDGERPGAVHELPVAAVVAAPQEADAGERVLRPADEVVAPQRA